MASKALSSSYDVAEINIVPLLDVLLVLVVVLLLLTPFMAKSLNVDLPAAVSGAVMTQDSAVELEIKADGSVWHKNQVVLNFDQLALTLEGATVARVFADKGAAFIAVTKVLDALAQKDIHNVQFAVKD